MAQPKDIQVNDTQQVSLHLDFIPTKESALFIKGFRLYVRLLFKRRFKQIWIKQEYEPCSVCKTVYFLNHHSWWDGLIPLLLNEYRFHQKARAMMEDKQMKKYPFFQKIGAFSINRNNPRSSITSLRYAIQSFQRPHSSLFIYPEGQITPAGSALNFEDGLSWLYKKLPDVDFVPIGIYLHTIRYDKPELHLHIGRAVTSEKNKSTEQLSKSFEAHLAFLLQELRANAGFDDSEFERFF